MSGADKKRALVLIADGTEEMEAVITIDVLVRGGIEVTVASTNPSESTSESVKCSRGVRIVPDTHLSALPLPTPSPSSTVTATDDASLYYDVLFIPGGGPGAQSMAASPLVHKWIQAHITKPSVLVAAVCAGPTVLRAAGVAKGAQVTSHPSVKNDLQDYFDYRDDVSGSAIVVKDEKNRLLTSRGPGSTFELALKIVQEVRGKDVMESVRAPLMFP
ncbi:Protein deglycase DJ-1zDJ-1 [Lobosporangium transversale]|uniref:D-lactate dehydratase n=1 Tax=Lobosporangium transversale TaxID=64571 RepID=A0A1Y2H099_9FUNG|nr:class I glutamine amidotransferase-like protein [Lobosporangium transversale]KAF9916733.1 Protein deglycase DJ-1zDJ-1 [Lobosporangium transversale]ORZ26492.1 class I glutamine amidotransferase-like protein [Lobosporangium transversale]|eukprot:XP_021884257.1 class I glutamine amidotransferase-like protein [Lobosporangium transversale]